MAGNPNAIFSQALAVGPRQIPLSELQGQMAQTAATQQQTAESAQQTGGLAQQNELRRRQLEDEQAVRDTMARYMKSVPITAPNVNLPTAGVDQDGNPLPNPPTYHQAGAAGAVQLQLPDIHGMYTDLIKQGRWPAAQTLLKTVQGIQTTDLENAKTQMANFETANNRRAELAGSVVKAAQEDPSSAAGVARQVGLIMEREGHLAPGASANLGVDDYKNMYRAASGAKDSVAQARAELERTGAQVGLATAQTKEAEAGARKTAAEAGMSEKELQLMNQALSDPASMSSSIDGLIDPVKYADINARTKKGFTSAMMLGGPKAAQQVLTSAMTHINTLEENKIKATDPDIIAAQARRGALERQYIARLAGGALANVPTEGLQRLAFQTQTKAQAEYSKAEANAQRLFDTADLAQRNGNQIASGMLPLEVLREVVPRVARQEIPMAQGGVSIARRFQNWIDRGATGVPSDITIKDIRDFGKAMLAGAKSQYATTVRSVNKTTGAEYDEAPESNLQTGPAATPAAQPAATGRRRVTTQAEYNALPAGTPYIDAQGNPGTKGKK